MKRKICAPRIFGHATLAGLMLLGSTSALSQTSANPATGSQHVRLEGQLEIIHQDFKDGRGRTLYFLKRSDGHRVPLQFSKEPPTRFLTGDHVRADGKLSGSSVILYSGNTDLTSSTTTTSSAQSSIPVPNTFGAQSTLVILVNFQDYAAQPYTVAEAQNAFFVTSNNFFLENSYGQTSLSGDVVGWYTLPDSVTTCNMTQIASDAQNAAAAGGANLANYTRYVYVFPYNSVCGWAGSSYVGGNPSQSWINDNVLEIHIINHELGHAFGIWHSHLLDCGTSATVCSSGTVAEYGDLLDTMGVPQTASAHYNAFQKERLGWLNYGTSPSIQTVQASGTYTINPYEVGGPGPNALKILKATDSTTGAKTWYYLEARQAVGFDAFLTNSTYYTQNETNGVLFHIGTDGNGNTSDLLDMTPATLTSQGWFDMSLAAGQTYQDSTAGVSITPTVVSGSGATVQVTMNGQVCAAANPTVAVSPSQSQSVASGTPVNFTVTVTDNDSSSCAPATFNLGSTVPSGWAGLWSAAGVSLSPGKSGSATLTVTSPAGTPDGSYPIGVSAINASAGSFNGSASATYVINTSSLSIRVATNQSSYLPGQTVGVIVTLLYGTSPDVGASVTVTVTNPNGKTTTLNGTTGSNGVALLSYKLTKRAAAGTYQVQFGSSANRTTSKVAAGPTAGASTSFTVQ